MKAVPEKDRDGRTGASHRPSPRNHLGRSGSVHGPSTPSAKCVALPAEKIGGAIETAEAQLVPEADACGALGCTRSDVLYRVANTDGETRVLCPAHVEGWVRR